MLAQTQMHVQIKHSPSHLQDLIPTLAGVISYIYSISYKNTFGVKKVQPSKVESYLDVNV